MIVMAILQTEPEIADANGSFEPSAEEVQARIRLLDWLTAEIACGAVAAKVGDYVVAAEGRILGVGPDLEKLTEEIQLADPGLSQSRTVAYCIPHADY